MNAVAEYQRCAVEPPTTIVEKHAALVRRIAVHLAARLPASVEVDDLCQAGMIGLLEAARSFDPHGGASFETFAGIRVRGAMIDELRRGDWAPRSVHRKMRDVAATTRELEQRLGREVSEGEVAGELGMSLAEYRSIVADATRCQVLSMESENGDGEASTLDPAVDDNPLHALEAGEFKQSLASTIDALPEREKLVLSLYYNEEMNLKEIGAVLGVSESRVCQIHGQAVLRVRARLGPVAA